MLQPMAIINITPDSYSDGGQNFSKDSILHNFNRHLQQNVRIFDIGFESTAPFTSSSFHPHWERERYHELFKPLIPKLDLTQTHILSIDTYRGEFFREVYQDIQRHFPGITVIWNDISGSIDLEMQETLRACPHADYVLMLRRNQDRHSSGGSTLSFISPSQDHEFYKEYVHHAESLCTQMFLLPEFKHRTYIDPGIGFSKNRAQSRYLIRKIPEIVKNIATYEPKGCVISISRKTCLRSEESYNLTRSNVDATKAFVEAEKIQHSLLTFWQHQWKQDNLQLPILFRVHDPSLLRSTRDALELLQ